MNVLLIMSFDQLKLKNQLCHRLYMASNGIIRHYRESLDALDLTYPQYIVMMALWEQDDVSIAQLIETTSIDGSALTQILKKISQKSLIEVVRDDQDRRKRWVKLLPKGQELIHKACDVPSQIGEQLSGFNSQDAEDLTNLLDKFLNVCR